MFKKFKKKHIIYASLLIGIFSLFMFCTIAYSAINGTVKISGNAYARVEADARITDFRLASSNNATSSYEEFGKNHIATEVDLVDSSSSITYYVEVTNYGSTDVGVYSISGLPSGVNYSIKDYNLKDKICDENNVCHGFVKKTLELTLTTASTYSGSVLLTFDIRPFLNISYVGFSNQYLNEFIAGDSVSVDLSSDNKELVYAVGQEDFKYTYYSKILRFSGVWCNVEVGVLSSKGFPYTGDVQTYKVKADGVYKIELWGAQGGNVGGKGAYTSGNIKLNSGDTLYFYVGGMGTTSSPENHDLINNNFNSGTGTAGQINNPSRYWGSGGGSTDVRLVNGSWDNFNSLKSRIMVAGSGGGRYIGDENDYAGGDAGGLAGYDGVPAGLFSKSNYGSAGYGGKQTTYGYCVLNNSSDPLHSINAWSLGNYCKGGFGYGGNSDLGFAYAAGGNGYYGGGAATHVQSGGGGSSFISWHDGCDAITENSTSTNIVHTGQSIHYSDYVFSNTIMIDGRGYKWTDTAGTSIVGLPSGDGSTIVNGNTGNGYAKITPVAAGNYNLMKFKYYNNDYSYMSYVLDNSDYSVTFNEDYADVIIKYKDGSDFTNYSYDRINKKLDIFSVDNDIEISVVRPFDVDVSFDVGGDECIHNYFSFQNIHNEHFPITIDYYHKESYVDEYSLVETIEFTSEDDFDNWFYDCDTIAYENYDVRIEFKANNGYVTSVEANVDTECFVAGTKVLVENGYKNIEDIQVGDYVYALDLDTNEKSLKQVTRKFEGLSNETYEIVVNGEKITATPKHEFYVIDKGWIRAYDLEVGDVLNSFNNGHLEITDIKYVMHSDPVKVYNLTVDGLHNYLISSDQLLVHNSMSVQ